MKKIVYILFFALAGILSFSACDREKMDNDATTEQGEGTVNLASLRRLSVDVSSSPVSRAGEEEVNTTNYLIRIYNADKVLVQEWKYSELPEIFTLKVGSYTVQAMSHEVANAEFEKPYYFAEESFAITANAITDLEPLVCKLQNVQVSVEYDDKLKELMGDDVKATVVIGDGSLVFTKDDTRSGYFKANSSINIMNATMRGTIDGKLESFTRPFSDVKPGQHRIVKFYLKYINDDGYLEGGFTKLKLTIIAQCTVIEKGVIVEQEEEIIPDPNPSEPEMGTEPTIAGDGFNIDGSLDVPKEGLTVVVDIASPNGIANLKVKIDSETLTSDILEDVGLASEFDLAYPGSLEPGLKGLGFPTGEAVIGAKEIKIDISQFTGLLGIYGEATHKFIITVIDQKRQSVEKTLTLISVKE